MLFFRSEELANEWCGTRGLERRPLISLEQLGRLAVAWFDNRLAPDMTRPRPDEVPAIFAKVGLEGPFWDPQSDDFG